jgi:hypothetical protein
MAGGLVQLIIYGTQDIFLTGSPQITFFKICYRRHTNFALQSIKQHFIGTTNFGQEMTSIIDKIGDLMNRAYIEIEIPKINLVKNFTNWSNTKENSRIQFETINEYYQLVKNYISTNTLIANKLLSLLKINNIQMSNIEKIISEPNFINPLITLRNQLIDYVTSNNIFNIIKEFGDTKRTDLIQEIHQMDIQILVNSILYQLQKLSKYFADEEEINSLKI